MVVKNGVISELIKTSWLVKLDGDTEPGSINNPKVATFSTINPSSSSHLARNSGKNRLKIYLWSLKINL